MSAITPTKGKPTPKQKAQVAARKRGLPPMPSVLTQPGQHNRPARAHLRAR